GQFSEISRIRVLNMLDFMRSHHAKIEEDRNDCNDRHKNLCEELHQTFGEGSTYPWSQLARLRPRKFISDIVESCLGAIYVDNCGNLPSCKPFLERIGLLVHLRRFVRDRVDVRHPKDKLNQLIGQ